MADWNPNRESLKQLLNTLQCTQHPNTEVQRQVHLALQQFGAIPEYNYYLMFIFIHLKNEPEYVRIFAGICLKNNLLRNYASVQEQEREYLKSSVVQAIGDPSSNVRRTCGIIINAFIGIGSIASWPSLLPFLSGCLDHADPNIVGGALSVLDQICEDHTVELDSDGAGRPLDWLLSKLLSFFTRPEKELRRLALMCITKFIDLYPSQMKVHKDNFIQGYFHLACDPDILIRRRSISAFVILGECHMSELKPYLPQVIELILCCMQHENEDLALEATDFWKCLIEYEDTCDEVVKPMLPKIFPVLLSRMVYSHQHLIDMGIEENSHIPDKDQDIKPQFTTGASRGHAKPEADEDDDDDQVFGSYWDIRKGSAEALDSLCRVFQKDALPTLLPHFEQGIRNPNWLIRESSILGLGCISIGCSRAMEHYLPSVVPFLFEMMADEKPLIRSITCWTLGRYSAWIFKQKDKNAYSNRLITDLLNKTQDRNKSVQKSAVSTISAIVETVAEHDILPYLDAILNSFNVAFQTYQKKNLVVLYDAISTLAECLGSGICNDKYEQLILVPLLRKWESLRDDDTDLFPVLECLSFVAISFGSRFERYAKPIFDRSLRLIEMVLVGTALHQHDNKHELPNRDFLICSIDLLSGLCEALRSRIEQLVQNSKLIPLLHEACKDPSPDYCQSCFALVGDLSKYAFGPLSRHVNEFIPLLVNGIHPRCMRSTNNAIWALGEIATKLNTETISPFAQTMFDKVVTTFYIPEAKDILETCAVTIGRIGGVCPNVVAPHLGKIIRHICIALCNLPEDSEKEDAARGLCIAIERNPQPVVLHFQALCDLITSFINPKNETFILFRGLLHAFKNQFEPLNWKQMIDSFPRHTRETLRATYNV